MIPDEAVEAAARAIFDQETDHWFTGQKWDEIYPDRRKEPYRRKMRAALEAAAPHMMPARELLEAAWDDGNCVGLDGWIGPARGEPVDDYALQVREGFMRKALDGEWRPTHGND